MSYCNLLNAISDIGNEIRAVLMTLAVVAVILAVVWLCVKYQSARIMTFTILACVYLVFTMYSLLSVITYYRAHGGIFGGIDKIEKLPENDLTIDEDNLNFNFTNISLKAVENGYSAGVTNSAVIDLDKATYTILVNNTPVGDCENSTDYILGEYTYSFYDTAKQEILTDTLTISIAFNELGTECVLTTAGNGEAVKYWNYYFAKNGFVVTIEKDGYIKADNWDILTENQLNVLTEDISSFKIKVNELVKSFNLSSASLDNYLSNVKVENAILKTYKNTFSNYQNEIASLKSEHDLLLARIEKIVEKHSISIDGNEQLSQRVENLKNTLAEKLIVIENLENTCAEKVDYIADCMVANIVNVEFIIDEQVYNSQSLEKHSKASSFDMPAKDGYIFLGWSLNGEIVNNAFEIEIVENTTFIAVYELIPINKVSVIFEFDNSIYASQMIEIGSTTSIENPSSTNLVRFNYWTINGEKIDLSTYVFNENTTIVANVTYFHYVRFISDGQSLGSQYVEHGKSAVLPAAPVKDGYNFIGWSINGVNVIDNFTVNADTTFVAVFEIIEQLNTIKLSGIEWKHSNGNTLNLEGGAIWTDGINTYYSLGDEQYVLNENTLVWEDKSWSGLTDISGWSIWTDGVDTYQVINGKHYVLDKTTSTWNIKDWYFNENQNINCSLEAEYIWSDGIDVYYDDGSTHLKLDKATSTWNINQWQNTPFNVSSHYIWTDGVNVYYSRYDMQYKLDKVNSSWVSVDWENLTSFIAYSVFSDGENICYIKGNNCFVLDSESLIWTEFACNVDVTIENDNIWFINGDCYYSNGSEQFKIIVNKN